jgi:hypothetical protein
MLKAMTKVYLKFPSFFYLAAFRKYAEAKNWTVNLTELSVCCICSKITLESACTDFNAVLVEQKSL